MIAVPEMAKKAWTEAEIQALPDDGYLHEVVNGERKFFPGAPDLAVEVRSPSNTHAEIQERLKDFFASGTQIAWIINPEAECVEVCHSLEKRTLVGCGGHLDGEHLLPGFQFPIADLFKDWDWEGAGEG